MTRSKELKTLILTSAASFLLFSTNVAGQEPGGAEPKLEPVAAVNPVPVKTVDSTPSVVAESAAKRAEIDLTRPGVQQTDPFSLSLQEAIRMALESNNTIAIVRDDVRISEQRVRGIRGFYDPVFSATPTYNRNSTTGSTATNDFTVNSSLTQELMTGANYSVFLNNSRTESAFSQAQVSSGAITTGSSAIYSSNYGIRLTQPLLRNLSIDGNRRNLKIARRQLQQSDADFRRQTIDTIALVQRTYWDLVFALRDQQNRQANLELTRENLRQVEARIAAGAAAPLAKAEVETELANREGDLLLATQQVSTIENNLKALVLREATGPEWARTIVPTDRPALDLAPVAMDDAVRDAMANRYELQRLKLAQDINAIDRKYFKNQTRPQVDLNGSFSLSGFARGGPNEAITTNFFTSLQDVALLNAINSTRASIPGLDPIPNPSVTFPASPSFLSGGFNRSLANTLRGDAPNYSIGVTISFPIGNRTAKANLATSEIEREQLDARLRSQEQTVIVEVRNAVQALDIARQRILIARRARENAEIQLEGERRLFEAGRSTTFLLFQRENALTNARNAEIRAETDYNKAVADLQKATSTTFTANNIEVVSPTDDN
ncbi:MAG: TolC family protein [Acidobacteria bacterium]|nr:TolC family protein [Acidobacteriota bacterium]